MNSKLLCVFLTVFALTEIQACTTKDRLVRDLLKDYLRDVDPGQTKLKLGVGYLCAQYDQTTGILDSRVWEKYAWKDDRLTWNPSEYGGIKDLRLPARLIWNPDVKLYNADMKSEERDDVNVVISSNGNVMWIPPANYRTRCTPSSGATANCKIQIGSWAYSDDDIGLEMYDKGFDPEYYLETCPYQIVNPTAKIESKVYPCCPESYSSMHIAFDVKARG